jgi:hypothetical protein
MIEIVIHANWRAHRRNEWPFAGLALVALAGLVLLSGCSQRHSTEPSAQPSLPVSPSPAASPDSASRPGDIVRGALSPGGVATTYEAHFENGQLQRIAESRKSPGPAGNGEYAFYGARLMHYRGAALQSAASVELQFDMQGSLTDSHSSDGKVSEEEVSAIRTRAQVLRSHAVARHAMQGHEG